MNNNTGLCEDKHYHKLEIQTGINQMPTDDVILEVADAFKVLSDSARLKIILALMQNELCVCDIGEIVGLSQSATSHQLRILRNARLAKFRKAGKLVYYSIDDEHVAKIINQALEHIKHL